uniref:Uncharacterized protein n=1 Tax=Candidatus Kentrum sp. DK TaxID=2126562 RepID=A0A450S8C3_9GAMM|nr:MAG: hypothetical protein BECKDK2373B_GA0170837_100174 [Candidatus Kentron sp. DK]VFJ48117.1 MAG: hypothetical protein BECKDK2373C_GA0170839_102014 [Candidatus Kentron sp. DK]
MVSDKAWHGRGVARYADDMGKTAVVYTGRGWTMERGVANLGQPEGVHHYRPRTSSVIPATDKNNTVAATTMAGPVGTSQ